MNQNTGFLNREVDGQRYVVYVPWGLKPPYPTILFLHGMGESGTDGLSQSDTGLGHAIRRNPEAWPFLVLFPQKPTGDVRWSDHAEIVNKILAATQAEWELSTGKRYITGLSQGGYGTFALAANLDWQFAAAVPICGIMVKEVDPLPLTAIPFWIFHGSDDEVVPAADSLEAVEILKSVRANVRLTLYPGVGHNSWDLAYAEPDLPNWLLKLKL